MAFDGIVISNIVYDMNRLLTGGRIYKIYQPEADELLESERNVPAFALGKRQPAPCLFRSG